MISPGSIKSPRIMTASKWREDPRDIAERWAETLPLNLEIRVTNCKHDVTGTIGSTSRQAVDNKS